MALASLLGLAACGGDPVAKLSIVGSETRDPPAAQRQAIETALAHWADGRFTTGTPRWFTLTEGAPPVAVMKRVDNELAGKATRIVETGPDGEAATLWAWTLAKESGGHDGLVVAVSNADPKVGAYVPIKRAAGWP